MSEWLERAPEDFWDAADPFLFDEKRWANAAEEVANLVQLIGLPQGATVLDLCCGPGRHSLELARRGFQITGVDRRSSYLESARRAATVENVKIEFVQSDMREIRFPDAFDAAINLFTSFGYFENPADDLRVLERLHHSLKPGGWLAMEMNGKEILARNYKERDWHETKDGHLVLEERKVRSGWESIDTRWVIIRGTERREFNWTLRLYSGTELAALAKQAGFATTNLYGTLDGRPYDHNALRLVLAAQK